MRNGRPKPAVSPFSSVRPGGGRGGQETLVPLQDGGRAAKAAPGQQGGQEPRRGSLAAVQVLGHGGLAVQRFPEPGGLGPGQAQGHGHGGRVEAQDAPRRRRRSERAAGAGRVPVGVVADAGGPGNPDHHVVTRHQGREQLPAGRAVLLGHGQGRGDDHDTGVERGVLMNIVDLVHPRHGPIVQGGGEGRGAGRPPDECRRPLAGDPANGPMRDGGRRRGRPAHGAADPVQQAGLGVLDHGAGQVGKGKRRGPACQESRGGWRTHLTAAPFPSGEDSRRRSGRPPPS